MLQPTVEQLIFENIVLKQENASKKEYIRELEETIK